MLCPRCSAPISKSDRICGSCDADLTLIPRHPPRIDGETRRRADRLVMANYEAKRLHLAPKSEEETQDDFCDRVGEAVTREIESKAHALWSRA